MSVNQLAAEGGVGVVGRGEQTGARMQMSCVKERVKGVFMWKKVRIGMSRVEGAAFISGF